MNIANNGVMTVKQPDGTKLITVVGSNGIISQTGNTLL